MPDLHDELERLAARAEREPSFEELRAGRDRRDRRRGRRALVVGLCVALVGTLFAFSVLRSKGPVPLRSAAGFTPPSVPYLWPENWARPGDDTPQDIQDKVDAGAKSLQWRTDPEEVAARFVASVLGWAQAGGGAVSQRIGVPGLVFALRPCAPLPVLACPGDSNQYVWVQQPVRTGDGGIWDVAGAWADTLDTGIGHQLASTVDTLSAGGSLHMDLTVPPDQTVIVGYAGHNGCSDFGTAVQQGSAPSLGNGPYTLPLDPSSAGNPDVTCGDLATAYAFAYTVPKLTTPTGDPFLESAAITAVTAMPFVLDLGMQPSSAAPTTHDSVDQITIACDATSISIVGSDTVIAQPDGVHVRLDNGSTEQLSIGFESAGMGDGGYPGTTDLIIDSPPGQETASCQTMSHAVGSVSFTIVDPGRLWVSPKLSCPGGGWMSIIDRPVDAPGRRDVFRAARAADGGIRESDTLVRAGYPMSYPDAVVMVLRDGKPFHVVFVKVASTGWRASRIEGCRTS